MPTGVPSETASMVSRRRLLDLQLQYVLTLQQRQSVGVFVETYNLFNKRTSATPAGIATTENFMVPVEAGAMRSVQLGVRYSF